MKVTTRTGLVAWCGLVLAVAGPLAVTPDPASAATCTSLLVTGHRGYVYPNPSKTNEDTLAAFSGAVSQGATGVELDLYHLYEPGVDPARITAIVHDPTWDRTISASSMAAAGVAPGTPVTATTRAQRLVLRTKGGQPVPSLTSVIDWSAKHPTTTVLVEVKSAFTSAEVQRIHPTAEMSFYGANWAWVQPFQQAGYSVGIKQNTPWTAAQYAASRISYVVGALGMLTATEVATIKGYGQGITVTTTAVGTAAEFGQALADGYDGLEADLPSDAVAWVRSGCP